MLLQVCLIICLKNKGINLLIRFVVLWLEVLGDIKKVLMLIKAK